MGDDAPNKGQVVLLSSPHLNGLLELLMIPIIIIPNAIYPSLLAKDGIVGDLMNVGVDGELERYHCFVVYHFLSCHCLKWLSL